MMETHDEEDKTCDEPCVEYTVDRVTRHSGRRVLSDIFEVAEGEKRVLPNVERDEHTQNHPIDVESQSRQSKARGTSIVVLCWQLDQDSFGHSSLHSLAVAAMNLNDGASGNDEDGEEHQLGGDEPFQRPEYRPRRHSDVDER